MSARRGMSLYLIPLLTMADCRSTSLQKFFEENNLQTKKWVDKDWIVANWK
jgi:hypothetical protein